MVTRDDILEALRGVNDPEMPINIVDLGLVERIEVEAAAEGDRVGVDLLPTFIGCPALDVIVSAVRQKVTVLTAVSHVDIRVKNHPPWSVDRISAAGREALRKHRVT